MVNWRRNVMGDQYRMMFARPSTSPRHQQSCPLRPWGQQGARCFAMRMTADCALD